MEFKEDIDEILNEISILLTKKRHDYGDSFERIWGKVGPISVVVRLMDKMERLYNLIVKSHYDPVNETIEDTFKDIIGYCLLSLRVLRLKHIEDETGLQGLQKWILNSKDSDCGLDF